MMETNRLSEALALGAEAFEQRYGVSLPRFRELVEVVRQRSRSKVRAGRSSALTSAEQVLLTLERQRLSLSLAVLAEAWQIHESTASRIVSRVEAALARSQSAQPASLSRAA